MKKSSKSRRRNRNQPAQLGFGKLETRKLMAAVIGSEAGIQQDSLAGPEVAQTQAESRIDTDNAVQRIVNGEQTDGFEAVGYVGPLGCTGTLISPTHVLTAAHCTEGVGNTQGSFEVNGQTYNTTRIFNHPDYDPNNFSRGDDIAIMELDRPVNGVTPMQIFRETPQVGTMLTLVGFGEGGTSTGGFDPNDTGKQVGQTELEVVTAEHISWNFDKHSESNTAPGDSGGPAFITVNEENLIAGVTSGGDGDAHSLGDFSFDTRVDVHAAWIDGIVGNANDGGTDDDTVADDDTETDSGTDDHSDTANNSATKITLNNNGVGIGNGTFEQAGDRDAFRFTLAQDGQTTITLREDGSDVDTILRVYDSQGDLVAENDDFGGGFNSQLKLDLDAGEYFAVAGSYDDSGTGGFKMHVKHTPSDVSEGYTTFSNNQVKEISADGRDRIWTGINVRGMEGNISDLNVTVDIDHTWVSDLRLILVAPDRTRIVLVNRQGDDGQNFEGTTFDRQATQHINNGVAPFQGTFRPAHNLNKLNGMDPNGRWYLVAMDFVDGDGGQLNGWSMDIQTDSSRKKAVRSAANFTASATDQVRTIDNDSIRRSETVGATADRTGLTCVDSRLAQRRAASNMEDSRRHGDSIADARRQRTQLLDTVFSDALLTGV